MSNRLCDLSRIYFDLSVLSWYLQFLRLQSGIEGRQDVLSGLETSSVFNVSKQEFQASHIEENNFSNERFTLPLYFLEKMEAVRWQAKEKWKNIKWEEQSFSRKPCVCLLEPFWDVSDELCKAGTFDTDAKTKCHLSSSIVERWSTHRRIGSWWWCRWWLPSDESADRFLANGLMGEEWETHGNAHRQTKWRTVEAIY